MAYDVLASLGPPPSAPGDEPDVYGSPEWKAWKARADPWRLYHAQKNDLIGKAYEQGIDISEIINPYSRQVYQPVHEMGLHDWNMWKGMKSEYGDVDPNARYDWANHKKTVSFKYPQVVDIEDWEWDQYNRMQALRRGNPNAGIGDLKRGERLQYDLRAGHVVRDPGSGMYYNVGRGTSDPSTWEWYDQNYKQVSGPPPRNGYAQVSGQPAGVAGSETGAGSGVGSWFAGGGGGGLDPNRNTGVTGQVGDGGLEGRLSNMIKARMPGVAGAGVAPAPAAPMAPSTAPAIPRAPAVSTPTDRTGSAAQATSVMAGGSVGNSGGGIFGKVAGRRARRSSSIFG